jgi:hypothetical protein
MCLRIVSVCPVDLGWGGSFGDYISATPLVCSRDSGGGMMLDAGSYSGPCSHGGGERRGWDEEEEEGYPQRKGVTWLLTVEPV